MALPTVSQILDANTGIPMDATKQLGPLDPNTLAVLIALKEGEGGSAATIANGADVAQGTTTDAPVADNTTVASATAATAIALWKRLVNLGIAILAKLPGAVTPHVTLLGASSEQIIPSGAKGWSYVILTGTATVGGVALVPAGVGDSDPNVLAASLTITTASASSAYVRWNT